MNRRLFGIALLLAATMLAPGCGGEDGTSAAGDVGVLLSEVSDHPEPMFGRTVTITGAVRRRVTDHALLLGGTGRSAADAVTVLSADELDDEIDDDDVVGVTGTVRPATHVDLSSYGVTGNDRRELRRQGGIVVAHSIDRTPTSTTEGDTESRKPSAYGEDVITIGQVVADPKRHLGEHVTVSGEIESTLSERAFFLGDAKQVVVSATATDAFAEATAVVTGVVRQYDRQALRRRFGVRLPRRLFDDGRIMTIVASKVRVVA